MSPAAFNRDLSTWAAYLLLGYFSFLLNGLGPLLPFLRVELELTYAQTSLHSSAFAIGLLVASATAARLGRRVGAGRLLWGGALGMGLGGLLLAAAPTLVWSLLAALVMGTLGSSTLVQVSAVLSQRHGDQRARAITEANAMSSLCGIITPLVIGASVATGLGWRATLAAVALLIIPLYGAFRRAPFAPRDAAYSPLSRVLPRAYWPYWCLLLLGVAVEFGVIFWAVDFLHGVGGLSRPAAATALSAFLSAMLLGRIAGTVWSARLRPERLLVMSLVLALVGFSTYWLVELPLLRVLGLVITGLGVANLYPLTLSLALSRAPGLEDKASARASLASGLAILVAPFALGVAADLASLRWAQVLIPLLLTGAWLVLYLSQRGVRPSRLDQSEV